MYDYNGPFLQIECGKIALERLAPKGFLQSERERRAQLNAKIREIEQCCGMKCPQGNCELNAELPSYTFRIIFGAFVYQNDIRRENIFNRLRWCLEEVRLDDSRKEALDEVWQRAMESVLREEYQAAISDFQKVYYYAHVSTESECLEQEVRALNGIALVIYLDGDVSKAINYLLTAYARTQNINAYLPKAQYSICCNLGSLFYRIGRGGDALSFFLKAQEIALRLKKPDYMLNSRYSLSCCQIALGRYEEAGSGFEQLAAWMEQSGQEEAVLTFERLSKECYKWANQALHVEIEKLLQTNERLLQDLNRAKLRSQILSGLSLVVRCGSILYNIYLVDCKSADIAVNIVNSIIAYLETIPRAISAQGDVNIGKVINSSVSILGQEGGNQL